MTRFRSKARARDAEMMDAEDCGPADLRACLKDLETVNRLTFAYRPTLAFLERLRLDGRLPVDRALAILDVGSGYGDGLRALARWGARRGVELDLTGLDRNPYAASAARERKMAREGAIRYVTGDVFSHSPIQPPDLIVSSLFAHHLDDARLVRFLAWMEATAGQGWFVNDLRRSRLSFHGFRALSHLAGWHRFVRHDGPLSIARSFREADWRQTVADAGIAADDVALYRVAPFRLCLARVKAP